MLAAMALLAAPSLSCIDAAAPPKELDVSLSEGAGLESTCTPTGPEICFNAKDDNCNGVIDEGPSGVPYSICPNMCQPSAEICDGVNVRLPIAKRTTGPVKSAKL